MDLVLFFKDIVYRVGDLVESLGQLVLPFTNAPFQFFFFEKDGWSDVGRRMTAAFLSLGDVMVTPPNLVPSPIADGSRGLSAT